jgi:hypothetical protein
VRVDAEKAKSLTDRLLGKTLDGWIIEGYKNHGKSAAVFQGQKAGQTAAVKVFDTELIERYGDQAQLARIRRELELRGQKHENLVSIYGGGHDAAENLYFVVMEFLDGPNLKEALPSIRPEQIPDLVRQLAAAARFLENLGMVHRDIKPENIQLLEDGRRLVLLDLGVIVPIKGSNLTDPEGIRAFIGTLQYSSPEFLLREEKPDLEGWRSLTFYQIGAVLHDLIMKRPIFEKFADPYAKLVNAVQQEQPSIANPEVLPYLIDLARNCLLKNPATRLKLVRWESFNIPDNARHTSPRERLTERLTTLRAQADEARGAEVPAFDTGRIRTNILGTLHTAAVTARATVAGLPRMRHAGCKIDPGCADFCFDASVGSGLPHGLTIRACVSIIDAAENVISCSGCAYLPSAYVEAPPAPDANGMWFQGVLDNVALLEAFEAFFFGATEWCIAISPGVDATSTPIYKPPT